MTTKEFNHALHNLRDKEIFDKFYHEICPQIFKISLSIFHNESLCRDIAQDIFNSLLVSKNLTYVKYPRAWLYTICKNAGLKYIRNNEIELEEEAPYTSIAEQYNCGEVEFILRDLTVQEREIIELHYLVRYSLKEIAEKQKRQYFAVAKQHRRILKKLEEKLSKIL